MARLALGEKSAAHAARFVDHVIDVLHGIGVVLRGVLSDNGPEFTGRDFTTHLADRAVTHHRIPPRSPNHNAVCERFQGPALQEFYRPAFHRQRYNTRRRNHSDFMRGRTALQLLHRHLQSAR